MAEGEVATKRSDLPVRAASAMVMLALAIGALVIGGETFNVFVAVVAFAAFIELWDPLESTCRHASLSIL